MIDKNFWAGKKVLLTGHTGFKGSWLCLWLNSLGAKVTGYSLEPPTNPSLFDICGIGKQVASIIGDIRDYDKLYKAIQQIKPDIVIHMAAQSLVRKSYKKSIETYAVNVMGTVHLLEAVRHCNSVRSVVNVTTDKCYENKEWLWGYRENEQLGGYDPYSNSKACSELVTSSYRDSFFNPKSYSEHNTAIASARAGNVIGGGDWATDRLVPDCIQALLNNKPIRIRNPNAIRPWQHVLEPLNGYLLLARNLYNDVSFAEAWNFGPDDNDAKPVSWVVEKMCSLWGGNNWYEIEQVSHPHEAHYLKLDYSKTKLRLNWHPYWNLEQALEKTVEWVHSYRDNHNMYEVCLQQIKSYCGK